MRVLVIPADTAGCGYYRLLFAAEYLQGQGHDIHIMWPEQGQKVGRKSGFEIHLVEDEIIDFRLPVDNVDVVVLQRLSHDLHMQVVPLFQRKGIAVVVDMDDDLSAIHRDNSAYWNYSKRSNTPFSAANAVQVCKDATLVTVSTKSLFNIYVKHGRGQIIDNYVPERYLDIMVPPKEEPLFGWGGTLQSHPADLKVCGTGVQEAIDAGHKFKIVGPASDKVRQIFRLKETPEFSGVTRLFDWPSAIAELDVGMAPLEASQFNQAKSRLKPLEYNALGIPYVASPREEYRRYHKDSGGAGFLANTGKEWATYIKQLMGDETLRKELGEQGKSYVSTQTVEQHAWRWLEAWQRAYDILRKGAK